MAFVISKALVVQSISLTVRTQHRVILTNAEYELHILIHKLKLEKESCKNRDVTPRQKSITVLDG
jgi:hypothetical protein